MAIDIKAILGDTTSTVMTPSEIAQLGLQRKSLRMQQERLEKADTTGAIGSIINNLDSFNTQKEIDAANIALNELRGNVEGNPNLKAYYSLAEAGVSDNSDKLKKVRELEGKFDTFDLIDQERVEK